MKILFFENYLTMIRNSVGTNMFRNLNTETDGVKKDITENGNLSCAFFASSVLKILGLSKEIHATVEGTLRDLLESGWYEVNEPKIGAVLFWEKFDFGGNDLHKHVGFYIGENKAISNNSKTGNPQVHDYTFEGTRKIEKILWNDKLE